MDTTKRIKDEVAVPNNNLSTKPIYPHTNLTKHNIHFSKCVLVVFHIKHQTFQRSGTWDSSLIRLRKTIEKFLISSFTRSRVPGIMIRLPIFPIGLQFLSQYILPKLKSRPETALLVGCSLPAHCQEKLRHKLYSKC